MRSSLCKKILREDPICVFCKSIDIHVGDLTIYFIQVDGFQVEDMEAFAIADGFASLEDMHAFWLDLSRCFNEGTRN